MTSAEAYSVNKQPASTLFRTQLLVQRWRGSSGNVRLSHLVTSFLF